MLRRGIEQNLSLQTNYTSPILRQCWWRSARICIGTVLLHFCMRDTADIKQKGVIFNNKDLNSLLIKNNRKVTLPI